MSKGKNDRSESGGSSSNHSGWKDDQPIRQAQPFVEPSSSSAPGRSVSPSVTAAPVLAAGLTVRYDTPSHFTGGTTPAGGAGFSPGSMMVPSAQDIEAYNRAYAAHQAALAAQAVQSVRANNPAPVVTPPIVTPPVTPQKTRIIRASALTISSPQFHSTSSASSASPRGNVKKASQDPESKFVCKPRPKDNRPKGGGGGSKRRFVPWC